MHLIVQYTAYCVSVLVLIMVPLFNMRHPRGPLPVDSDDARDVDVGVNGVTHVADYGADNVESVDTNVDVG